MFKVVSTNTGIRPFRNSSTVLPVGVGPRSRGPTGVVGCTSTTGRPSAAGAQDLVLGDVLGLLVARRRDGRRGQRRSRPPGRPWVAPCSPSVPTVRGVDHPLAPGLAGPPSSTLRVPAHVDVVEVVGVRGPEPVQRGNVEDGPAAVRCLGHRRGIPQVGLHLLDVQAVQVAGVAPRLAPWPPPGPHGAHSSRTMAEPMNPAAPVTSTRSSEPRDRVAPGPPPSDRSPGDGHGIAPTRADAGCCGPWSSPPPPAGPSCGGRRPGHRRGRRRTGRSPRRRW